jgi:hypothetical protein
MAFGEDPADFSSDEASMPDRDDDNYLDREGNLSCSDADWEDDNCSEQEGNLSGDDVGDLLCDGAPIEYESVLEPEADRLY